MPLSRSTCTAICIRYTSSLSGHHYYWAATGFALSEESCVKIGLELEELNLLVCVLALLDTSYRYHSAGERRRSVEYATRVHASFQLPANLACGARPCCRTLFKLRCEAQDA
jgi:hypothetical protein